MMNRLQWEKLLSEDRIRKSSGKSDGKYITRNQFEADYDRIVGSSSVRRLQDKAQVFPLQKNDVVRTRLTHSIEVSAIARSLAKSVGLELENRGEFDRKKTEQLMGMLQTAGLIHDLGNPPFGHYGETVIRNWYRDNVLKQNAEQESERQEDTDFLFFDGNVQNLRILTKLQTMNDEYGVNFTYGTLASIIKYPYASNHSKHKKNKFGYFKSEEDIVMDIWAHTGLGEGIRHPAAYLLEAADDITYLCDDIEDGVKKGYVPWEKEFEKLFTELKDNEEYINLLNIIKGKEPDKNLDKNERLLAKVRVFRNYVQGHLIKTAIESFFDNYDAIMDGTYGLHELLESDKKLTDALKRITVEYCFSCDEVLTLEVVGERVICELLNIFYKAISRQDQETIKNTSNYEGKIYHLISDNYKYIAQFDYKKHGCRILNDVDEYDRIHLIIDFISGMTDSYAVSLYKKLLGISLPA